MLRSFLLLPILLVFVGSPTTFGQEQGLAYKTASPVGPSYDQASFGVELHRLSGILKKKPSKNEMAVLRDSLPKRWVVSTSEGSFAIPSEPLRNQLTSLSSEKAEAWVNHLAEETESSAQSATGSSQVRGELERILARPEFGAVRPPSAWELFRKRLELWIERMLLRLFGGIARYPLGGQILYCRSNVARMDSHGPRSREARRLSRGSPFDVLGGNRAAGGPGRSAQGSHKNSAGIPAAGA